MRVTGPLFKWFGSKWLSSKTLPNPRHDVIIEPFAGSAGYSLRHSERDVVLCELDPHASKLWSWLIHDASDKDVREIPLGVPVGTDIQTLGLSHGQALLMKSWQRTNNVGDCWTISAWGDKPGQWTANTRARVADQVGAIKHWRFCDELDGLTILEQDLGCCATWFVDPPYQFNYAYGFPPIDHEMLGTLVRARRDHVIVCEAVCGKTGRLPKWLPFRSFGSRITSRRAADKHHHSLELIWESGGDGD